MRKIERTHTEREKMHKWDQFIVPGKILPVMVICRNFTFLFQECSLSVSVKICLKTQARSFSSQDIQVCDNGNMKACAL